VITPGCVTQFRIIGWQIPIGMRKICSQLQVGACRELAKQRPVELRQVRLYNAQRVGLVHVGSLIARVTHFRSHPSAVSTVILGRHLRMVVLAE